MARKGKVVGAGKTVDLIVRTSGIGDGEQAQFEIFRKKDDKSLGTAQGKVVQGKAKATWKAQGPEPDDDEQEWELYYKVRCKGRETRASGLKVYTDWIEVETVDPDGNPLQGAIYELKVSATKRRGDSGTQAKFKEEDLPYGRVRIDWKDPYYLVEWVDEKGPKRKAKVRKVLEPKLLWPAPRKGVHKQWVNHAPDPKHPEYGSKIELRVTLDGGLKGDPLFVKTAFAAENSKRNDPQPGLEGANCTEWAPEGGRKFTLPSDGGEVKVPIELGLAGGDVVDVWLSGSEEFRRGKTVKLRIVNWRKVYYQATVPKGRRIHSLARAKSYLRQQAFVEYVEYARVQVDASSAPKGSWIRGIELGKRADQLNVGSANKAWFQKKFQDTKSPLGCHLILCDTQYDEGVEERISATVRSVLSKIPIKNGAQYDVFSRSIKDGSNALKSGTWKSLAPAGHPHHGKSGAIDPKWITCNVKKYPNRVRLVLGGEAARIVGKGTVPKGRKATDAEVRHPLRVELKIEVARGPFLGEQDDKHQLLVLSPNKAAFNATVLHELGHALAQCLSVVPPGLDAADHKNHKYTNKGHSGPHCRYGVPKAKWAYAEYWGLPGRCVMFGEGSSTRPPRSRGFCKYCRPFVRAHDCKKIHT
ncbi:MAG: hypothetical protein D6731_19405 [Planctomycetota bacterium]|nr:MAG: hypothetical protein D6731_19405 [Planctomycetota bacterium]